MRERPTSSRPSSRYLFGFELLSLFLYIFAADQLHTFFVGAMCAAGSLYVNGYDYPALILKLVNFLFAGLWLILNYADNRAYDYPLIKKKYALLLFIGPLILGETALQAMAKWYGKTPDEFVSSEPELWFYDESLLRLSTRPVELTWRMEVTSADGSLPVRGLVLVDAASRLIVLPYQDHTSAQDRKTDVVNSAVLAAHLGGTNTRRIRRTLEPLLGGAVLSKSAISRVVVRLKADFEAWRTRDLSRERYVYLYLDATFLPVRLSALVPSGSTTGEQPDGLEHPCSRPPFRAHPAASTPGNPAPCDSDTASSHRHRPRHTRRRIAARPAVKRGEASSYP